MRPTLRFHSTLVCQTAMGIAPHVKSLGGAATRGDVAANCCAACSIDKIGDLVSLTDVWEGAVYVVSLDMVDAWIEIFRFGCPCVSKLRRSTPTISSRRSHCAVAPPCAPVRKWRPDSGSSALAGDKRVLSPSGRLGQGTRGQRDRFAPEPGHPPIPPLIARFG